MYRIKAGTVASGVRLKRDVDVERSDTLQSTLLFDSATGITGFGSDESHAVEEWLWNARERMDTLSQFAGSLDQHGEQLRRHLESLLAQVHVP